MSQFLVMQETVLTQLLCRRRSIHHSNCSNITIYESFIFAQLLVFAILRFTSFIQFGQRFILECYLHLGEMLLLCKGNIKFPVLVIFKDDNKDAW